MEEPQVLRVLVLVLIVPQEPPTPVPRLARADQDLGGGVEVSNLVSNVNFCHHCLGKTPQNPYLAFVSVLVVVIFVLLL